MIWDAIIEILEPLFQHIPTYFNHPVRSLYHRYPLLHLWNVVTHYPHLMLRNMRSRVVIQDVLFTEREMSTFSLSRLFSHPQWSTKGLVAIQFQAPRMRTGRGNISSTFMQTHNNKSATVRSAGWKYNYSERTWEHTLVRIG